MSHESQQSPLASSPDACVHRKPTVLSSAHIDGRIGVEEPLHTEPPHDLRSDLPVLRLERLAGLATLAATAMGPAGRPPGAFPSIIQRSPFRNAVIVSHVGTHYLIKNAAWNGTIAAGAKISFGFQADGIAGELPSNKKVNGVLVA